MAKNIRERAIRKAQNRETRPYARARYIRMSPTKVDRILKLIRLKPYNVAEGILQSLPHAACEPVLKVLRSAAANAENNKNMSKDELVVVKAVADCGPTLKRMMPRAKGSGDRILKKTCHITVVLDAVKGKVKGE